jgi:hypothetical protein
MKTEVYSWRLSPRLKMELEEAARAKRKSLADLLEQIAQDWLTQSKGEGGDEDERQRRLHGSAMRFVGTIEGDDPNRAENARSEIRSRIARRHGR